MITMFMNKKKIKKNNKKKNNHLARMLEVY